MVYRNVLRHPLPSSNTTSDPDISLHGGPPLIVPWPSHGQGKPPSHYFRCAVKEVGAGCRQQWGIQCRCSLVATCRQSRRRHPGQDQAGASRASLHYHRASHLGVWTTHLHRSQWGRPCFPPSIPLIHLRRWVRGGDGRSLGGEGGYPGWRANGAGEVDRIEISPECVVLGYIPGGVRDACNLNLFH